LFIIKYKFFQMTYEIILSQQLVHYTLGLLFFRFVLSCLLNNVLESSPFSDDLGLKNDLFLFQEPSAKNKPKNTIRNQEQIALEFRMRFFF